MLMLEPMLEQLEPMLEQLEPMLEQLEPMLKQLEPIVHWLNGGISIGLASDSQRDIIVNSINPAQHR